MIPGNASKRDVWKQVAFPQHLLSVFATSGSKALSSHFVSLLTVFCIKASKNVCLQHHLYILQSVLYELIR